MDILGKLEQVLRRRHRVLKTELAKIEHLIDAFERGVKSGAKRTGRNKISAAGRKRISLAQKARWAKKKRDKKLPDLPRLRVIPRDRPSITNSR